MKIWSVYNDGKHLEDFETEKEAREFAEEKALMGCRYIDVEEEEVTEKEFEDLFR